MLSSDLDAPDRNSWPPSRQMGRHLWFLFLLAIQAELNQRPSLSTSPEQPRNPPHEVTLEQMLERLVEHYGWSTLGNRIRIKCFNDNPSVKSSLIFLRKTPWARQKVEGLYISMLKFRARAAKRRIEPVPETNS